MIVIVTLEYHTIQCFLVDSTSSATSFVQKTFYEFLCMESLKFSTVSALEFNTLEDVVCEKTAAAKRVRGGGGRALLLVYGHYREELPLASAGGRSPRFY